MLSAKTRGIYSTTFTAQFVTDDDEAVKEDDEVGRKDDEECKDENGSIISSCECKPEWRSLFFCGADDEVDDKDEICSCGNNLAR